MMSWIKFLRPTGVSSSAGSARFSAKSAVSPATSPWVAKCTTPAPALIGTYFRWLEGRPRSGAQFPAHAPSPVMRTLGCLTSRDFVPRRFSDACRWCAWMGVVMRASEKPDAKAFTHTRSSWKNGS